MGMEFSEFVKWSKAKEIVKARKLYDEMNIASYPNGSKEARTKYFKSVEKRAFPDELREKKVYSNEQAFAMFMKASGNGR